MTKVLKGNVDICLLSETKLDDSFTTAQFCVEGYHTPFRKDRHKNGGGLMFLVNQNLIVTEKKIKSLPEDIEAIFLELNLRKQKLIIVGVYRPPTQPVEYFISNLRKQLSDLKCENIIVLGDFNLDYREERLTDFMQEYDLSNLVKEPTCFKSVTNPSAIDHIWVTDRKKFVHTKCYETGLSDWHKLTTTMLNISIPKTEPRVIQYRDYRNFKNSTFKQELQAELDLLQGDSYGIFDATLKSVLDKHAPIKKKILRSNSAPFMSKRLRKEIMQRSRKRNVFNRDPTAHNWNSYRIQRNKCTRMIRDAKKAFYGKINLHDLKSTKKFWNTIKPIFSEKAKPDAIHTLVDGGVIINDKQDLANTMADYYANVVNNLGLPSIPTTDVVENEQQEGVSEIENIINKYNNHPSILKISSCVSSVNEMNFNKIDSSIIEKHIIKLKKNKASPLGDIPVKILKKSSAFFAEQFEALFEQHRLNDSFPQELKCAEVSALFKKGSKTLKDNYRPVSKLPVVSKIFERCMYDQIYEFVSPKLSPFLSGFRKGYSSQHPLLHMFEKWHQALDKKHVVAAVLMDLSKAFDCINHDLLIAKMHAYGFSMKALALIKSYLSDRKQRIKVNDAFSSWHDVNIGVPQGSILGPLLFNIYLNDFFMELDNDVGICNYADDNTVYASGENIVVIKQTLERALASSAKWFQINGLRLNADKCELIVLGGPLSDPLTLCLQGEELKESDSAKLLGIEFDNKLSFSKHIIGICKRANGKLNALKRIKGMLTDKQKKIVANSFILSEFAYCPLVWSFSSRTLLGKMEHINERANKIFSDVENVSAIDLHRKFCECLLREIFKIKLGLNPSYMNSVFPPNATGTYGLRNTDTIARKAVKTSKHGLQTVPYIGSRLWESLPESLRNLPDLASFRTELGKIENLNCKCRLCAEYVPNLGYIE